MFSIHELIITIRKDLFSTLVPMAVHNGLQGFKTKKMDAFNLEIGKLRQATELLNAYVLFSYVFTLTIN